MSRFTPLRGLLSALAIGFCLGCSGEKLGSLSGEIEYGKVKPVEGETWMVMLEGGQNHSIQADNAGKFVFPKVPEGTYKVQVMRYASPSEGKDKSTPAPKQFKYPESWTVPGGPYKLDLSKLSK